MIRKTFVAGVIVNIALLIPGSLQASNELFIDGRNLPAIGTIVGKDNTFGGYRIYTGGRSWRITQRSIQKNNLGQEFGLVQLVSPEKSDYFSEIHLMISLQNDGTNVGFTADPCAYSFPGIHKRKLTRGTDDNCLNIDAVEGRVAGKSVTALRALVHITKSGGRFYRYILFLNVASFGFENTDKLDWSEKSLVGNPGRKRFAEQFFDFAKSIQDVANIHVGSWPRDDRFATIESIESFRGRVVGAVSPSNNETSPTTAVSSSTQSARSNLVSSQSVTPDRKLQGTIVVKWEGYDQIGRGTISVSEDGKTGQVMFKAPDGKSSCGGVFEYFGANAGRWAISCTNESRGNGTFLLDRTNSVSTGVGVDQDGKKIDFTILY